MEDTLIEISWTTGSLEEARKVARYLAQERLVACAQIIPWVESIYMWNNQLETMQETKVIFKTILHNYETIRKIIQENTSYQIPEILYRYIDGGNDAYIQWSKESLLKQQSSN